MRTSTWGLVVFALLVAVSVLAPVVAAEGEQGGNPPPANDVSPASLTPEQAADKVPEAFRARDEAALKALARKDEPDPWLVADELLRRGARDAAAAFAKAAPRADTEALPAYVATWQPPAGDAERRARLESVRAALDAGEPATTIEVPSAPRALPADVIGVRLAQARGLVLFHRARLEDAYAAFFAAGQAAETMGWLVGAGMAFQRASAAAFRWSDQPAIAAALERLLVVSERRGDRLGCAKVLGNMGLVYQSTGKYDEALATFRRVLETMEALGDERGVALSVSNIGLVYYDRGEYTKALPYLKRALALRDASGDRVGAAGALGNLGLVHHALGDAVAALAAYERAYEVLASLGDRAGAAGALVNIGNAQASLGDIRRSLETYERARRELAALEKRASLANVLANIGCTHRDLGNYAKALSSLERALDLREAIGDRPGAAMALASLGTVQDAIGDHERALATLLRAYAALDRMGSKGRAAGVLRTIGSVYASLGDHARALDALRRALVLQEDVGDEVGAVAALSSIGVIHYGRGDDEEALGVFERVLDAKRRFRDRVGEGMALLNIGVCLLRMQGAEAALETLEQARAVAEEVGDRRALAHAWCQIAQALDMLGRTKDALAAARLSVHNVARLAEGLAQSEGAFARDERGTTFGVGMEVATKLDDALSLAWFLEKGRGASLRQAWASKRALEAAVLPDEMHRALLEARSRERTCLAAWRRATASGSRAKRRDAREKLDGAQASVTAAASRIEREAKAAAAVALGAIDDLDTMRGRLADDEALVLYGAAWSDFVALVVRRAGARIVRLGEWRAIEEAATTLLDRIGRRESVEDGTLAALARAAVEPLALEAEVRRVLVSPVGQLGYVPFGLLLPDKDVVYVPSGTMSGILSMHRDARGDGVLAVGNPDYERIDGIARLAHGRGGVAARLPALPATRKEVEAIGTVRLLGARASESVFRQEVKKARRWRAVHFACHGLLDAENPMHSSLALTPEEDEDGFLKALEVLRLRIPADLVVLSACDTARGRIFAIEGITGMAQAFMFAGAPRVICSLWKVDDDATQALMVKFYELWNPKDGSEGLGAAAALKKAQEHVRGHERWKHPYFWAAWVLWGLPR